MSRKGWMMDGQQGDASGRDGTSEVTQGEEIELTDELRWRARALEAEAAVERLSSEIERLQAAVASAEAEAAVGLMDEPDVSRAVEELKASKPFLFGRNGRARSSVMSAHSLEEEEHGLSRAAASARERGDRASLLAYLRMRREAE